MSRPSTLLGLIAVALVLLAAASAAGGDDAAVFAARFKRSGLVTNEFAYWNPRDGRAHRSPDWQIGSGSLFARSGVGWTGVPGACNPDPASRTCTDSAIFRLTTRRADFADARVSFSLRVLGLTTTAKTPAVPWDGVHVWLRYRTESTLYYASVARRDGHLIIKKKCPGGPSNGGTYYVLAERSGFPILLNRWRPVAADATDLADGAVRLRLEIDGQTRLTAVDHGIGCAPLRGPGRVGIRGDNANFEFRSFTVRNA